MPLADGATFAGYTIVRMLGSGGMGEVYLAQHPRLPRRDALKVLPVSVSADSEYRQRFNREADIAATLWHPHIVGVHDRGDVKGKIWISMDYVDGTDAGRLLRERYSNGMPKAEVVGIVTAVADALDYAHVRGLLHRDVKPANILLAHPESGNQRILLADFGIARWVNDISTFTPLPPPPQPVQPPTTTSPSPTAAAPVAVIGANCSPVGSTATMADGATAYCSTLQTTGTSIWSLNPGDVPSPTVTAAPTEAPLPIEEESPVRVCMQQTRRTRLACREEIRRSNLGLP